jgi:hypothetical protein
MMLERGATMPGMGGAAFGATATPGAQPTTGNYCVLPRCTIKLEKCAGGCKITCSCEDEVACGALQNLCKMLAGGMCSLCCTWNGMTMCQCNLCCGSCKCEMTKDGCCITCTSGDKQCCEMLQSCCACLKTCLDAGCCCYVCFNNTPVCCGSC